jgi:imidazolonepropionase-like amidohydrolase
VKLAPWVALFTAIAMPAQAVTLDCGRLLNVKDGRWHENVSVLVIGSRIVSIEPYRDGDIGERIDLRGYSCLPGLIDSHVHLTSQTAPQAESLRSMLSDNPADLAYRSTVYAERTLLAGFTTVRDLGGADNVNIALRNAINAGHVRGPRIFTSGATIASTGGHGDATNAYKRELMDALGDPGPAQAVVNGADAARQAIRQHYKDGADLIKITATGGVLSLAASGQNAQFTDEELKALIGTARDYGFKVAAHAHGVDGMKRALRAGVDSIEHGTFMDDEAITLFKQVGAYYVPTISAGKFVSEKSGLPDYYPPIVQPKAAAIGARIQDTFGRAWRGGVRIAFGTDAGVFPHGENAREFVYMVEAGMPPLDAIRSATIHAAALLGRGEIGQAEPGFLADLIAVEGDPLKDVGTLSQVRFVMKDGAVFKRP